MATVPDNLPIRVHSRRGGNMIHPVSLESPPLPLPPRVPTPLFTGKSSISRNGFPEKSIAGKHDLSVSFKLEKMGALDVGKVVHQHEGWRLITCMWLHGGVFHLLANMLSLLVIGIRLEQEFGFVRIGLLYLISGLGGSVLSALFIQSNISVGASGALFGLLGGMLSELITNWTIYANKVAALLTLVIIIAINLAVGILPHVDNFAHIGGFLSGFLLGFVFLIRPQFGWVNQRYAPAGYSSTSSTPKFKAYQCILWVLSLILLIVGFTVGLVLLLRGEDLNDHCSWCHYLSCVPTSRWSCNTQPISCQVKIDP
ncbi:UNVERIFIED_CONTAM: RHOMBOID-like protein 1 [Sesamum radiatum]|uniref:RHOMBOID-like protein n=1 Tax=Sesamum radiatum TaxID=300843 RepID=A0AAW2KV58_SESRA